MNTSEINSCLLRHNALWPRQRSEAEAEEWARVLAPLDSTLVFSAFDALRDDMDFPPSFADFRAAYRLAEMVGRDDRLALPSGNDTPDPTLRDRFGENQAGWVYCWRCDMALTIVDREAMKDVGYDPHRGLHHRTCPAPGSAPLIPSWEKVARDDAFRKKRVSIGPNQSPAPYREG